MKIVVGGRYQSIFFYLILIFLINLKNILNDIKQFWIIPLLFSAIGENKLYWFDLFYRAPIVQAFWQFLLITVGYGFIYVLLVYPFSDKENAVLV